MSNYFDIIFADLLISAMWLWLSYILRRAEFQFCNQCLVKKNPRWCFQMIIISQSAIFRLFQPLDQKYPIFWRRAEIQICIQWPWVHCHCLLSKLVFTAPPALQDCLPEILKARSTWDTKAIPTCEILKAMFTLEILKAMSTWGRY